jgi:hypothetical protein
MWSFVTHLVARVVLCYPLRVWFATLLPCGSLLPTPGVVRRVVNCYPLGCGSQLPTGGPLLPTGAPAYGPLRFYYVFRYRSVRRITGNTIIVHCDCPSTRCEASVRATIKGVTFVCLTCIQFPFLIPPLPPSFIYRYQSARYQVCSRDCSPVRSI